MNSWGAGYATGLAVGIGMGIVLGMALGKGQQKSWEELSERERKQRKAVLTGLGIVVLLGFIFFWLAASWGESGV